MIATGSREPERCYWRRGAATHYHVAKCRRASPAKNRQGVVMVRRLHLAIAVAMPLLGGLAAPAWCQATKATAAAALDPAPSATPDPLTPPQVNAPPPTAPGVPGIPSETAKPAGETDPIVALVRQRLATAAPASRHPGDREDYAGLVAFYAEHAGEAVWTSRSGFTPRATQALSEIRKADDWGLKASVFDLPALPRARPPRRWRRPRSSSGSRS